MGKTYDIPRITIHVEGGLVQDVDIPESMEDIQVIIKDYDKSDYMTEKELAEMKEDESGKYHEAIYAN